MGIRSGRRKVDSRAGPRAATLAAPASGDEIDVFANAGDYAHLKGGSTLGATINNFGTGQRWPTRPGTEPG